jgi:hypothetical protein
VAPACFAGLNRCAIASSSSFPKSWHAQLNPVLSSGLIEDIREFRPPTGSRLFDI